ncbi:hypothetical protein ACW95P_01475 [Candidatus Mycoplasma pogonae]
MLKFNNHKTFLIKKKLKKLNLWNDYKSTFPIKKHRFLIFKIAKIFEINISENRITKFEANLINCKNKEGFLDSLNSLFTFTTNDKLKDEKFLKDLATFLYYCWQLARLKYDKKYKKENIYIDLNKPKNLLEQNRKKREYYYKLCDYLKKITSNYNYYVVKILKVAL